MKRPRALPVTAGQVLSLAKTQLGVKESPAGSNRQKFGRWFGWNGAAWCSMFVTWLFAHVTRGGVDIRRPEWLGTSKRAASTIALHAAMVKAGWVEVPRAKTRRGDIVFWAFGGGRINHVSVALGPVKSGMLRTRDGNSGQSSENNGGMVCDRSRPIGSVAAVVRPPYAKTTTIGRAVAAVLVAAGVAVAGFQAQPVPTPKPSPVVVTPAPTPTPTTKPAPAPAPAPKPVVVVVRITHMVGYGATGTSCRAVQHAVHVRVDGQCRTVTVAAIRRAQRAHHLRVDGVAGKATITALAGAWPGHQLRWAG